MIWRNSYVKERQDIMFKRKTRKKVLNEGNKKGLRAITHREDRSIGT